MLMEEKAMRGDCARRQRKMEKRNKLGLMFRLEVVISLGDEYIREIMVYGFRVGRF